MAATQSTRELALTRARSTEVANDAPLLEVDSLDVAIRDAEQQRDVFPVRNVTFDVNEGETVGIVGESGSGKSMTCRAIMGLVPTGMRVVGGTIRLAGTDVLQLPKRKRSRLRGRVVSLIPQDPASSLNPVLTIGEQIGETARRHRNLSRREVRELAIGMLERVHVPEPRHRLSQYPHELSGGMRQRVASVIALIGQPRLVLADEPTTALDVTVQRAFIDTLMELKNDLRFGLVFVTHDLALIAEIADRINVMYAGQIVESGPTDAVIRTPRHPYTRALLDAIPQLGPTPVRPRAIPGEPIRLTDEVAGCPFGPRCPLVHERCLAEAPPNLLIGSQHSARCWVAKDL